MQLARPWIMTNGIRVDLITSCSAEALQCNVSYEEEVRDMSGGDCDISNDHVYV